MCFFNNNCCPQQRPPYPRVIVGPQGPRGPIGPQGPAGAQALANGIYAGLTASATVATNSIIPITQITATPNTTLSVSNNAINLPSAGTYLVSYSVNGSTTSGDLIATLYLNGSAVTNESITLENTAGDVSQGSKTILLTTTAVGTLSLYNTSAASATLSNATITALLVA